MAIIDIHAHFGGWLWPVRPHGLDDLRRYMKRFAIDKACVASSVATMGEIVEGNAALAEALSGADDFAGWCVVSPNLGDVSIAEMQKYLRRREFVGVKMHAAYHMQPFDSPAVVQLVKAMLRFDKPLLVEVGGESDMPCLDALAAQFPSARIIVGSMGEEHWQSAIRLAQARTNVVLDCGGPVADRDKIAQAMAVAGPNRVVFGTGQPLVHPAFAVGAIRDAELTTQQKEAVLQGNARRLLGL